MGDKLFKICYPKSFKNSSRFGVSTLQIMVERGNEVELEYSKKQILEKMNSYFGYIIVEKLKIISFEKALTNFTGDKSSKSILNVTTNTKFIKKIVDIKNDKIKNSLIELNKIFKGK